MYRWRKGIEQRTMLQGIGRLKGTLIILLLTEGLSRLELQWDL